MNVRVSFVITNYNYGRYVAGAIDSLLAQSMRELEIVVIDDCSTDGSRDILRRYADEPRVRLVMHERNRGHIQSYNEGIGLARGEFIGLFDADDLCIRSDAVARQVAVFDAAPDAGLVYSAHTYIDEDGVTFREFKPWAADYVRDGLVEFGDLAFRNYVSHTGTLIRRGAHERLGTYDSTLPHSGDWELWLRIATAYQIGYIAEPLYAYRLHGRNMSVAKHSPRRANQQNMLAIERAFDALPAHASPALRRRRPAAIEHVLLATQWGDRGLGRIRRSWVGLLDAAWRAPRLLLRPMFYGAAARTVLLTVVGHARYQRLSRVRGARPMGGVATTSATRVRRA
jgi:glycosyltransferase involved in cell wall biosynthesis